MNKKQEALALSNANRRDWKWILISLIVLGLIVFNKIIADRFDEKVQTDATEYKLIKERDEAQDKLSILQEVWAMSTHFHSQQGHRFTREDMNLVYDDNPDMTKSKFPERISPVVPYWSDDKYELLVKIVTENPELERDDEKLVQVYTERLKELED